MKRIIKCPKCEAKLAVFDIGKPINQKCPKCGNAFIVESEENKDKANSPAQADGKKQKEEPVPASAAPAAAAPETEPKKETDAAAPVPVEAAKTPEKEAEKTAPAPEAAAKAPAEEKKTAEPKEIKLKKPEERPAPAAKNTPAAKAPQPSLSESSVSSELPASPAGNGSSLMFNAVVIGGLILIIVMQMMAKIQSTKQYGKTIEHLQYIEKNLSK